MSKDKNMATADPNEFTVVTITGKATEGLPDKYSINISLENEEWIGHEPGGAAKVLKDKTGTWDFHAMGSRGTTFLNRRNELIIELNKLEPGVTASGTTGTGHATQSGVAREVDWRVS